MRRDINEREKTIYLLKRNIYDSLNFVKNNYIDTLDSKELDDNEKVLELKNGVESSLKIISGKLQSLMICNNALSLEEQYKKQLEEKSDIKK